MYVNRLIRPLSCRPLRLHLQRMTTRLPRELVWGYTPCSCWETPKVVDHKAINHTYIHYDGHTHKCFISNNSYIFFSMFLSQACCISPFSRTLTLTQARLRIIRTLTQTHRDRSCAVGRWRRIPRRLFRYTYRHLHAVIHSIPYMHSYIELYNRTYIHTYSHTHIYIHTYLQGAVLRRSSATFMETRIGSRRDTKSGWKLSLSSYNRSY